MYSTTGSFTPPLPVSIATPRLCGGDFFGGEAQQYLPQPECLGSRPLPDQAQREGLLHDARNLMGTLGLYCDLLSMPGVLKMEHRQYAEELRLVGSRSGALIERLIEQLTTSKPENPDRRAVSHAENTANMALSSRIANFDIFAEPASMFKPVSLRRIVERCSGLLSRVAGGRAIEISYGQAASVPVPVSEEAVERILVNLVRNSAAALDARASASDPAPDTPAEPGVALHIGVGLLLNRVGDPKPWPFRRVRLTVEDSGCGMDQEQLGRLASGARSSSRRTHGIGFHVVQQLVAASEGDLRVISTPGVGTLVQIEWPVAAVSLTELAEAPSIAAHASVLTKLLGVTHAGIHSNADPRPLSRRSMQPGSDTRGWMSC
jgi:signal transduction histidine kinase